MDTNLTLPEVRADERDTAKSQWFTPPKLANRIADWVCLNALGDVHSGIRAGRYLEPSAGDGALVRAFERYVPRTQFECIDIDPRNVAVLREQGYSALCTDFLTLIGTPNRHDIAIMNPPYENAQAERHIIHALSFAPRVVAVVPLTTLEGSARRETLWSQVELTRMAVCSTRPKFGKRAGLTAIAVIDVRRLEEPKANPYAMSGVRMEFWR